MTGTASTILITGATDGDGRALADHLAADGARRARHGEDRGGRGRGGLLLDRGDQCAHRRLGAPIGCHRR